MTSIHDEINHNGTFELRPLLTSYNHIFVFIVLFVSILLVLLLALPMLFCGQLALCCSSPASRGLGFNCLGPGSEDLDSRIIEAGRARAPEVNACAMEVLRDRSTWVREFKLSKVK